jgi:YbgC/YbaW family acyl-CoA thioester hydrolase
MGIVYHAHYLVWFEIGRTEWCRAAGLPYAGMEAAGVFIPVTRVSCSFRGPPRYDDAITVRTVMRELARRGVRVRVRGVRRPSRTAAEARRATSSRTREAAARRPRSWWRAEEVRESRRTNTLAAANVFPGSTSDLPFPHPFPRPRVSVRRMVSMIARIWHGAVPARQQEAYRAYLAKTGVPGQPRDTRATGASTVLERATDDVAHFVFISLWESLDAIRAFRRRAPRDRRGTTRRRAFLLELEPTVDPLTRSAVAGARRLARSYATPRALPPPRKRDTTLRRPFPRRTAASGRCGRERRASADSEG